jgi:hypothetical protein
MNNLFRLLIFPIMICACNRPAIKVQQKTVVNRDTLIVLQNEAATLAVSLFGGAIVRFVMNDQTLNPLDWRIPISEMPENNRNGAPFQGHFLCTGRWGSPTEREKAIGIPHNGEPSNSWWTDTLRQQKIVCMETIALLEQFQVKRKINLAKGSACFEVEETLINLQNSGRFTAMVQHTTLGGDFLNDKTIINTNATYGFNQALAKNSLTDYEYKWPLGYTDSLKTTIDLTRSDSKDGFVTTHVIDEETGWATAASPDKRLLIGYLWRTTEYPWLHIWHGMKNGKLWAKGIEFGTTGVGDTYLPAERAALQFHGRNNNLFVDPKSSVTKKYSCFMIRIPENFFETTRVVYNGNQILLNYQTREKQFKSVCISIN